MNYCRYSHLLKTKNISYPFTARLKLIVQQTKFGLEAMLRLQRCLISLSLIFAYFTMKNMWFFKRKRFCIRFCKHWCVI